MKSFISYSSHEVEIARLLAEQLRKEDFIVMRDQDFLDGGQVFNVRLEQVLRSSDVVLLLLSRASRESRWVNEEIVYALELGKRIIPLKLEADAEVPFGLKSVQYIDMSDQLKWVAGYQNLVELLRRLDAEIIASPPPPPSPTPDTGAEPAPDVNPFIYGNRIPPALFVGRAKILQTIKQRIGGADLQSLSIVANRRMGKSSLLHYVQKEGVRLFPRTFEWVFVYLDMTSARGRSPQNVMATFRRSLVRQLPENYHALLWTEEQDGERIHLEESMEDLRAENVAVVLLLDEWEDVQAHIDLNGLVNSLRTIGNSGTVAMVTATAHELVDIYGTSLDFMRRAGKNPNDTSTFHNIFKTAYLGAMPGDEWRKLVTDAFARSQRDLRPSELTLIDELAGGHPYFVQLAGSILWNSIDEGWNESQIRREFQREAEPIFIDMWHKETVEHQADALRQILGIHLENHLNANQFDRAVNLLKQRGVLNDNGEIFTRPYADFIHSLSS